MVQTLRVPYKMLSAPLPVEELIPGKTALLLIDFQKYTCSRNHGLGKLAEIKGITPELDEYYQQVDAAISNVDRLLTVCRKKGIETIFTYLHAGSDSKAISRQFAVSKLSIPAGHLEDEFIEGIKPLEDEVILTRSTYSPFVSTNLNEILQKNGKNTLILAGTLFNYSVALAAREATDRGYTVIVVWDASASESLDWHQVTRTGLVGGLILSRRSNEVIEMVEGKRS